MYLVLPFLHKDLMLYHDYNDFILYFMIIKYLFSSILYNIKQLILSLKT